MKKLLAVLLFFGVSFLSADDEDFSYTYFDLSAVQADNTGYDATFSLGLPFSLYLRGSVEDIDAEIENAIFEKSSSIVTLGAHVSIADLLKNVTKDGFKFNFARFMDFYAELGSDKWELENIDGVSEEGTDAYIQGGIRIGDSEGWELSVYLENRSLAEVEISQDNGKAEYTLSDDVNNTLGIKFTNNFQENMSMNINLDNDDVIGSTASIGIRFRL
jgi:hypothetical protein|tara:strand:- start:239 stop:889 length:651 start_codon:yes stop_codon:yes gene_type:complete